MSRACAQPQLLPKPGAHMACPSLTAVPPSLSQVSSQSKWPQLITSQNLGFLVCEKKITTSPEIRGCVRRQARSSEPQAGSMGCSLRGLWVRCLNCQGDAELWVSHGTERVETTALGEEQRQKASRRGHERGARGGHSLHRRQGQEPKG